MPKLDQLRENKNTNINYYYPPAQHIANNKSARSRSELTLRLPRANNSNPSATLLSSGGKNRRPHRATRAQARMKGSSCSLCCCLLFFACKLVSSYRVWCKLIGFCAIMFFFLPISEPWTTLKAINECLCQNDVSVARKVHVNHIGTRKKLNLWEILNKYLPISIFVNIKIKKCNLFYKLNK